MKIILNFKIMRKLRKLLINVIYIKNENNICGLRKEISFITVYKFFILLYITK